MNELNKKRVSEGEDMQMLAKRRQNIPLLIISYGTLALLFGLIVMVFTWAVYPYKTIDFKSLPYKMAKTEYVQGEQTYYTVTYCKYTDLKPELEKYFEDGLKFNAMETKAFLTNGCRTQAVPLLIPGTLPPGRYKLAIKLTYHVNPIKTIVKTNSSNWFTVTKKE